MAQPSKEPCKKEACNIQACLSKNMFDARKYAPLFVSQTSNTSIASSVYV